MGNGDKRILTEEEKYISKMELIFKAILYKVRLIAKMGYLYILMDHIIKEILEILKYKV